MSGPSGKSTLALAVMALLPADATITEVTKGRLDVATRDSRVPTNRRTSVRRVNR